MRKSIAISKLGSKESYIPKFDKATRSKSSIPAPGSLKFGYGKKEDKLSASSEFAAGGLNSSKFVDTRHANSVSCTGSLGGSDKDNLKAQLSNEQLLIANDEAEEDPLNRTYTHVKLTPQLSEEDKFSRAIGKRVCISGEKYGILRYFGPFHLSVGLFCGVELEEELGNHDGFIDGRRYFTALPLHGIFAPFEKVHIIEQDDPIDPTPSKPSLKTANSRLAKMNVSTDFAKKSLNETFVTSPTITDDQKSLEFLPTFCRESAENAEFLEAIEPHLMCHSMLDDENAAEIADQSTSLMQSFDLSESLMFLKHSNFLDGSLSSSQLAALMQSTDDNRNRKMVSEDLDDGSTLLTAVEPTDLIVDENDIENLYFEEQTTPVCGDVPFLQDLDASLAKNAALFSSTPFDQSSAYNNSNGRHIRMQCTSEQKDVCGQVDSKLAFGAVEDRLNCDLSAVVTTENNASLANNVKMRYAATLPETTNVRSSERPISTVSADTGYQDDVEFDGRSGRSISPPEHVGVDTTYELHSASEPSFNNEENCKDFPASLDDRRASSSTVILDSGNEKAVFSEKSSLESLICETVYRDKSGNVVKVIPGSRASKKEIAVDGHKEVVNKPSPPKSDSGRKANTKASLSSTSPEHSPAKNKRHKADSVEPAVVSRRPLSGMKKETDKPSVNAPAPEHVFVRQKLVKEVETPPKKVRPPPKPSKSAEIMAKLQQSMAQDKAKPKRDVKSRVFTTLDTSKSDETGLLAPSRSQSRASSVLASAQISPSEGVVTGGVPFANNCDESVSSPAEPAAGSVAPISMVNGVGIVDPKTVAVKSQLEPAKTTAKPPIKRDGSRDIGKQGHAPPPSATISNKRAPLSKASSLSASNRFTKISGPQAAPQPSTVGSKSTATNSNLELEKKVQQLGLAKERLTNAAKGFEAICIVIKHYSEQVIPVLKAQILQNKADLTLAKENSENLTHEKNELSNQNQHLREGHSRELEEINKTYEENLRKTEASLKSDSEKKLYKQANAHEDDIKKIIDECRLKEKRLTKGYEKRQNDDALQYQHKVVQLKEQHTSDINEVKTAHTKEINDLTCQFDNVKDILEAKLIESQKLCDRYKSEARQLEATLMKDTEKKLHHVNERFAEYQKEIDSLRVVLEMKSAEIHELRTKCQNLEKDLETLPLAKTRIAVLEQKNAELKEMLELRKQAERRLSQKHLELQHTHEREVERVQRLSMTNEQLQYRLQHLMMSQSAYETPMSRFASEESDAESCIRNKPMSQSLIHIYAGSSPRTSKDLPVTVYTTEGISRALIFDKSDCENSASRPRMRTSSEHKSGSSGEEGSSASPSPQTTSRAINVDKNATQQSQRRISPLRRRNISGTSLVGVPNVETVTEIAECGDAHYVPDDSCVTSAPPDDSNVKKISKSISQGQGCWTDSGVFTSSFHSETADQQLPSSVVNERNASVPAESSLQPAGDSPNLEEK